jgi:hypothetical protein
MGWATFWATFLQNQLVTLVGAPPSFSTDCGEKQLQNTISCQAGQISKIHPPKLAAHLRIGTNSFKGLHRELKIGSVTRSG